MDIWGGRAHLVETHWPTLQDFLSSRKLCRRKKGAISDRTESYERNGLCTAHVKRVDTAVELLDADFFCGTPPTDIIEHHLLCLRRIVPTGLQEAPVHHRKRGGREKGQIIIYEAEDGQTLMYGHPSPWCSRNTRALSVIRVVTHLAVVVQRKVWTRTRLWRPSVSMKRKGG
jgi:hypothetical protein